MLLNGLWWCALFLVNCYLLHIPRLPSQPASSRRGWVIDFIWLELLWQYIAMTRNNPTVILNSLQRPLGPNSITSSSQKYWEVLIKIEGIHTISAPNGLIQDAPPPGFFRVNQRTQKFNIKKNLAALPYSSCKEIVIFLSNVASSDKQE